MDNVEKFVFLPIGAVLVSVLLAMFSMLGYMFFNASDLCAKRWDGAYDTTFTYTTGCKVVVNGRAIPERAVRDILNAVDIR